METGFPWQLLHQTEAEAACLFQAGPGNRRRKWPRVLGRPQCPFTDSRLCKAAVHSGLRGPPPPPQSRCQPCRGPCLGLRGQTCCHIHPSICETISLVCGPRAEVPISLPAVSREPRSAFECHPHAWVPGPPVSHGIDDAASPPPALSPRLPPVWPAGENALILKAWWERGRGGQMRPTGVLSLLSPNVTSSQAPSTLRAVAVCKQHWGRFRSHARRPALATQSCSPDAESGV